MSKSPLVTAWRRRWKLMIIDGITIDCALCGEPIPSRATGRSRISKGGKGGLTVDHIVPKSWGGSNGAHNLQPAHLLCNQKKGNRMLGMDL